MGLVIEYYIVLKKSIHDTLCQPISSSLQSKSKIQIIFDCYVIFFNFRPKSRPFLEKADFLRKKKTLFALFFQKGLLSRPRSTKEDPVGITGTACSPETLQFVCLLFVLVVARRNHLCL